MSSLITLGLAEYDCSDHYAILGVAIDASAGEIRKRYLKIARSLHPDTCPEGTDKQQASQFLSKVVNPAYEALSKDKAREEYNVLLRLVGQRVVLEKEQRTFQEPKAQTLIATNDFETLYQESVSQLAQKQYESLSRVLEIANRLSELNLAYLLRRERGQQVKTAPQPQVQRSSQLQHPPQAQPQPSPSHTAQAQSKSSQPSSTQSQFSSAPNSPASAPATASVDTPSQSKQPQNQFVKDYVIRAEGYIAKNSFANAIRELREGLDLDPKNGRCHSLMGTVYLKKKKLGMAKHHLNLAMKYNPQDQEAQKGLSLLAKLEQQPPPKKASQQGTAKDAERRGLFGLGDLFGGKK